MNVILAASILVVAGLLGGAAARRLRLPSVTGNIVAGILIGPHLGSLLDAATVYHNLKPISQVALSLIAVSIASHLQLRRLRSRALTLFPIALLQAAAAMAAVYWVTHRLLGDPVAALLLAVVAASTAPAATLAVIRETEAEGPLVSSLLAVVALDNVLAIIVFVVVSALLGVHLGGGEGFAAAALQAALRLSLALLIGAAAGVLLLLLGRRFHGKGNLVSLLLMAISLATGVALELGLSPLLPNMVLGFVLTNFVPDNRRLLASVEDLEPLIYLCFFTLAGTHLDLSLLPALGLVGSGYILARFGGKLAGAAVGGWLGRAPAAVSRWLGFCLLPQAGVAVGLIVAIQDNPRFATCEAAVTAVVLAAIVLSELLGPVLVRLVLQRAGETGRAGRLLFGIVPRAGITCGLEPADKWELLRELVAFAARTYRLAAEEERYLLASVLEREHSLSTGLGRGLAIPHGTIAAGRRIMGVAAVVEKGVDFGALDGEPARIVILMAVPKRHFAAHLETLAAISRVFSRPGVAEQAAAAAGPHDFYHLIYTLESGEEDE